jgi:FSR family fosmidomycin resistance protein-like MFS transporter
VELLDELVGGVLQAAWPLIRDDLGLGYGQIGLALAIAELVATLVEPAIGILGDTSRRRPLVLAGGCGFALSLLVLAAAPGFVVLVAAFVLFWPSSGAFVSLSQASLMDLHPGAHERNMARWTLAGSVGVVGGPLLLALALLLGVGWRATFVALFALSLVVAVAARRVPFAVDDGHASVADSLRATLRALRRREVQRWLVVLELSDLMLDVFHGFLALYFVDVVGLSPQRAALAVAVWTVAGLVGDALLLPILRAIDGLRYLRASAVVVAAAYPAFLLAPTAAKLPLLAVLGLLNSGWYAIPQARLFSTLPGQSAAAAMTIGALTSLAGSMIPLAMGFAADSVGLSTVMWVSLAAPIGLLVFLPRGRATLGS